MKKSINNCRMTLDGNLLTLDASNASEWYEINISLTPEQVKKIKALEEKINL